MRDTTIKIILEALAMQIDRLRGEVFIRDCEIEKLKEENKRLQETVKFFEKELSTEEAEKNG